MVSRTADANLCCFQAEGGRRWVDGVGGSLINELLCCAMGPAWEEATARTKQEEGDHSLSGTRDAADKPRSWLRHFATGGD